MGILIQGFLMAKREMLEEQGRRGPQGEHDGVMPSFALAAIKQLMQSDAYFKGDTQAVKLLAVDLIAANESTICLAMSHPDVFHKNVILSRQSENAIHRELINLVDQGKIR